MPKGVPKAGFRMTLGRQVALQSGQNIMPNLLAQFPFTPPETEVETESFEDIKKKVAERFIVMEEIVLSTAMGINPSLIISGAAGVGKSYTVMNTIESLGLTKHKLVKGSVTPLGLFQLLYEFRHEGSVLTFDDSDDVWQSDKTINLLKAATDTTDKRIISWHSSHGVTDVDGNEIESDFVFNGNIIFISNKDLYKESKTNTALAPHFAAMISRSFVLDVSMKNADYYLARIHQVMFDSMDDSELSSDTKHAIFNFMNAHKTDLRELSLRMVKKIHVLMRTYPDNWQDKARVILCH